MDKMQQKEKDIKVPYSENTLKGPKLKCKSDELFHRPFLCKSLNEGDRVKAQKELNETEENVQNGLKIMKDYLKARNLQSRTDDYFLMQFLRAQKYNIKKSIGKMKRYLQMRSELADFFESIDINKLGYILERQVIGCLPYKDKHGRAIAYNSGCGYNPEFVADEDLMKFYYVFFHFVATFPPNSVNGISYIVDAKVNSAYSIYPLLSMLRKVAPHIIGMPLRVQRIDIINGNLLFRYIYMAVKPLLPKKIVNRIHVYGSNKEEFLKHFPPSILPNEFGGTIGPLSNAFFRDAFLEYAEKFKAECALFRHKN